MNAGGCPLWHCPPPMPTWHLWRYRPHFRWVTRVHYTTPVPWTLGLLWLTSLVLVVPSQQILTFHSHAPSRSMNSCTPPNGFRAFSPHQQQNDLLFTARALYTIAPSLKCPRCRLPRLRWVRCPPPPPPPTCLKTANDGRPVDAVRNLDGNGDN